MLLGFFTKEATVNGIYLGTESQRTVVMKPRVGCPLVIGERCPVRVITCFHSRRGNRSITCGSVKTASGSRVQNLRKVIQTTI